MALQPSLLRNIWREKNDRIFNNKTNMVDSCMARTYMDASSLWAGQPSDRERAFWMTKIAIYGTLVWR